MSLDRESGYPKVTHTSEGNGGAGARAHGQGAGTLGRRQSHVSYALATHSAGSTSLECSSLSPRECGILELIGQGYSNKRVARALGITAETVKSHVKRVFMKLDVNTRAHAVARAQSLGLFGLEFVRPRSATSASEPEEFASAGEVRHSVAEY